MISRRFVVAGTLLSGMIGVAAPVRAQQQEAANGAGFNDFLQGVRRDARGQGISAGTLDRALTNLAFIPRVIELDRRQPESTLTFQEYLDRVVSPVRRDNGRQQLTENRQLLDGVAGRYGVEPRFILALWGIESDYGRHQGDFSEIGSLATLAYDGRRSAFFRKELMNALTMVEKYNIDPRKMTGSWAGAMGQCQFMPSSFLAYAASWQGDASPDIWTKRADVFASIANYLSRIGWKSGQGWGVRVTPPPSLDSSLVGLPQKKSLSEWAGLGIRQSNGGALQDSPMMASLIQPGGAGGPSLLVFDNFRVILKWNNSSYFGSAVGFLADGIV